MIKIAIVEDDTDIRESLTILLNGTDNFSCSATYSNAEDAIEKIPKTKPDVVLMDIELPKKSGIDAVREIRNKATDIQFIMLTVRDENEYVFNALCAGASGYLTKNTKPAKILSAIEDVVNGGSPMNSSIARMVVESFRQNRPKENFGLSEREKEVLDYLCQGKNYKYIADKLFISGETVRRHNKNIYKKLQVNSKAEAVAKTLRSGILD